jgi:hypothetical protein
MIIKFLGIDPGISGAMACLHTADLVSIFDLPVTQYTYLTNQSKALDIPRFAKDVESSVFNGHVDYVVLATEQMQGMGFKTPAKTLTMLAEMAGAIEATVRMVCREKNVPLFIRKYQPRTWTHWLFPNSEARSKGKTEAKNCSLEKARELFPNASNYLNLNKHHDRAEALLLSFVALAELQGCVVDPKLKRMGDLANIYLLHKQDAKDRTAKFTDIWQADTVKTGPLAEEIQSRKQWQN